MHTWTSRSSAGNTSSPLLPLAAFLAAALLLAGCGAQTADMAETPDDDDRAAATDVDESDGTSADTNPDGQLVEQGTDPGLEESTAPETNAQTAAGSEPDMPRTDISAEPKKANSRTAPFGAKSMTMEPRIKVDPGETTEPPEMAVERAAAGDTAAVDQPDTDAQASGTSKADDKPSPSAITVFYGTDRKVLDSSASTKGPDQRLLFLVVAAAVTLLFMLLGWTGWQRRLVLGLTVVSLVVTTGLGIFWGMGAWGKFQQVADPGVRFSNNRGEMTYGTCEVTIPASHSIGEIERPSILRLEVREDATKHVVLQATEPAVEDDFFSQLQSKVASAERREVFVFVHGYNVTFDGAARRTAQIAHDVHFSGAPVFFSWPSQGGLLKYTVDENNIEWAVPHLKQFLIDITRRSGATSVNLIAHSMGNRGLTLALRELQMELRSETALFNQIILAAPDVDAEIFRRDLAPALVQSAHRVTLYASSNDQALQASKQVHGYARAGDSGAGLVVMPGIETIDVSTLDTSLLGHSYYGSSDPILLDIQRMILEALPAAQRPFLVPHTYGELTYWVFQQMRSTANRKAPHLTQ